MAVAMAMVPINSNSGIAMTQPTDIVRLVTLEMPFCKHKGTANEPPPIRAGDQREFARRLDQYLAK